MKIRLSVWYLALLSLGFVPAKGQTQPDTLLLREVEVPASRLLAPVSNFPLQCMDADRIRQSGSRTLAEALAHFAGLNIRDYGGIGGLKTVNLRSLGAQHTAVFVDDIPLTEAASGQIDLGRLTLETTESITLASGGADNVFRPARWFASASSVALTSLSPDWSSGSTDWYAGITTGSSGLWQPFARLALKMSEKSDLQAGLRYTRASGTYRYSLQNVAQEPKWQQRLNSDVENLAWQSRLNVRKGNTTLQWHVLLDQSDRGLPGAVMLYNPYSRQRLTNTDLHQALVIKSGKPHLRWQSQFKHSLMKLNYSDPDFLNSNGGLQQQYLQQEYYFSQLAGGTSGQWQWSASGDLVWNRLEANHFNRKPERLSTYLNASVLWKLPRWELASHLLLVQAFEQSTTDQSSKSRSAFSPGLSVSWRIADNSHSRLRFSYKDAFRMPTFNELYYNIVGNPNLKPERAGLFNFGYIDEIDMSGLRLHFNADLFYNRVRDKIIAIPTKNLFVWSMRNIGKVSVTGFEAGARGEWVDLVGLKAYAQLNYSCQYAVDRSLPDSPSYNHQIAYIPRHSLNGFLNMEKGSLSAGGSFFFNSARYFLPENRRENRLPAWWTIDLNASYRFNIASFPTRIRLDINNILNRQYEVIRSFPMPGRSVMLTLSAGSKK